MILFMFVRAALCQESRADASGQARPGGSGDASSVGSAKHDCGVASEPMAAQIMLIMDAWAPKAQRGARILVARNNAIQRMELGHNGQMSLVELATPAGELGIMDDRVVLVTWTNPETKFGRFVHMKATTAVFSMGRHHKMRSMHDATIIHPAVGAQMVKAKDLQRSMSQLPDDILVLRAMWECCLAAQATMENTNFDTCIACDQNDESCQTCGLCQLTLHPACLERAFAQIQLSNMMGCRWTLLPDDILVLKAVWPGGQGMSKGGGHDSTSVHVGIHNLTILSFFWGGNS
jgi:hypothetical protein